MSYGDLDAMDEMFARMDRESSVYRPFTIRLMDELDTIRRIITPIRKPVRFGYQKPVKARRSRKLTKRRATVKAARKANVRRLQS